MTYDLKKKSIVIFGFGAQGKAHAMNLKDSGCNVSICLPKNSISISEAESAGFTLISNPIVAAKKADIAAFMVPDSAQKELYLEIEDHLPLCSSLVFAHGLNIHYKIIKPRDDLDIVLAAPLAHAETVRSLYLEKTALPVLTAVSQNVTGFAWEIARLYARGIGATDKSILETTFAEETETDLFVEQSLICGGIAALISAAFETLVTAGYSPEIAYYCCLKETQIMSNMFGRFGIVETFKQISETARFGALSRGPQVIDNHVKEQMKKVLEEIKSGKFMKDLEYAIEMGETDKDSKMMQKLAGHQIETIHNSKK